ncbi:MAG: hypothetical protein ACYCQI_16075 [Gammaproteobacteria bacterium]
MFKKRKEEDKKKGMGTVVPISTEQKTSWRVSKVSDTKQEPQILRQSQRTLEDVIKEIKNNQEPKKRETFASEYYFVKTQMELFIQAEKIIMATGDEEAKKHPLGKLQKKGVNTEEILKLIEKKYRFDNPLGLEKDLLAAKVRWLDQEKQYGKSPDAPRTMGGPGSG